MSGDNFYRGKYRAASARLTKFDYGNNGYYFVTICVRNRECHFGSVNGGKMVLSEIGKIVDQYWREIPCHFPFVRLDVFIVMPNHVHGIIMIDKPDVETLHCNVSTSTKHNVSTSTKHNVSTSTKHNVSTSTKHNVSTERNVSTSTKHNVSTSAKHNVSTERNASAECNIVTKCNESEKLGRPNIGMTMSEISPTAGSLSTIIRSYKSACTKTINRIQDKTLFQWQNRFHDHIIRDENGLVNIRNYIIRNPLKWRNYEQNEEK